MSPCFTTPVEGCTDKAGAGKVGVGGGGTVSGDRKGIF